MTRARRPGGRVLRTVGSLWLALLLAACGIAPEPVHVGSDECAQCRMAISEPRFAAQVLTARGRSYKFDSIECMLAFLRGGDVAAADLHSTWVADFDAPTSWLPAEDAVFVHSPLLRTPMAGGLSAHGTPAGAASLIQELGDGEVLDWPSVAGLEIAHEHAHAPQPHEPAGRPHGDGHAH